MARAPDCAGKKGEGRFILEKKMDVTYHKTLPDPFVKTLPDPFVNINITKRCLTPFLTPFLYSPKGEATSPK